MNNKKNGVDMQFYKDIQRELCPRDKSDGKNTTQAGKFDSKAFQGVGDNQIGQCFMTGDNMGGDNS